MRKLFLAVCVVLGSAFLAVPPAHAAPPPLPPGKSKHVCDTPAEGFARCYAHIRTDDNLNPLATSGPTGYGPVKLRNAYGITADGTANHRDRGCLRVRQRRDRPGRVSGEVRVGRALYDALTGASESSIR